MALTVTEELGQIEVVGEYNIIHVQKNITIENDGELVSKSNHRSSIPPGQDYSSEEQKVQDACAFFHTAEVIAAYEAFLTAQDESIVGGAN